MISEDAMIRLFPDVEYEGNGKPDEHVMEIDAKFNEIINRNIPFSLATVNRLLRGSHIYFITAGHIVGWFHKVCDSFLRPYIIHDTIPWVENGKALKAKKEQPSGETLQGRKCAIRATIDYILRFGDRVLIDTLSDEEIKALKPYRVMYAEGKLPGTQENVNRVFKELSSSNIITDILSFKEQDYIDLYELPPKGRAVLLLIIIPPERIRAQIKGNPQATKDGYINEGCLAAPITDEYKLPPVDDLHFSTLKYLNLVGAISIPSEHLWTDYGDIIDRMGLRPLVPQFSIMLYDWGPYNRIVGELAEKYDIPPGEFASIANGYFYHVRDDSIQQSYSIVDYGVFLINDMLRMEHPRHYNYLKETAKQCMANIQNAVNSKWEFDARACHLKSILHSDPLFASVFYSHLYDFKAISKYSPPPGVRMDIRKRAILPFRLPIVELLKSYKLKEPKLYNEAAKLLNGLASAEVYLKGENESGEKSWRSKDGFVVTEKKLDREKLTKGGRLLKKEIAEIKKRSEKKEEKATQAKPACFSPWLYRLADR
jgi:hypothetical protein